MGFYELFLLAEDMGAEPLPVVSCGLACQFQNDSPDAHVKVCDLGSYIQDALALPPSEWPDVDGGAARRHESQSASAPKSIRVWKERYPERLQVLNRVRKAVSQIAEDTRTPVEIVIKPQYLRNLCWTDEPRKRDVARFLGEQGARDWQVSLVAESVSRAIM